jgi:signal transduction histidine kinase
VKYTPEGGKITLAVGQEGRYARIDVTDTGFGIAKEAQGRIFTKLFRAQEAQVIDPQGIGLGLYLVHAIIQKAAGKIWFESEVGRGTSFHVLLPLADRKPDKV